MRQKSVESYAEKLGELVKSCLDVDEILNKDIRPRNKDNPMNSVFWREGAFNGALFTFMHFLRGEELDINREVLATAKRKLGGDGSKTISVDDYISAAVEVLDGLGLHIPGADELEQLQE